MFDRIEILALARSLSAYSGARQAVVAENVANADTPGYRARDLPNFSDVYDADLGGAAMRQTRPGHFGPDAISGLSGLDVRPVDQPGQAAPNGNSVSIETELVRAADIRSKHNMALSVYGSALDIMRAAIGRGR